MTIGIVGSRRRNTVLDASKVRNAFKEIYTPGDKIVSGGCPKGADKVAEMLAFEFQVPITIHLPDKLTLDKYLLKVNPRLAITRANYARNRLIARDADVLIACVADDRKGGTEHTIKEFQRLGKTYIVLV